MALAILGFAQTLHSEALPETTGRLKINLGATPWKFIKADPYPDAKKPEYDDHSWTEVGIPHCFNDMDTFNNSPRGIRGMFFGSVWYRKHFQLDENYKGKKIFIEFEGINIACAVYINGTLAPHISEVKQPGEVTHVFGFTPFVLDITDMVRFNGDNVISVRVSNQNESWYTGVEFGNLKYFGMGYGGIFRPVYLHITNPVHIPLNVYSNVKKWGTNIATISISDQSATVRIQTNVDNETSTPKLVTLVTRIVDRDNKVVFETKQEATIPAASMQLFDQHGAIRNPHLWYPDGTAQYLYKVYSVVESKGKVCDVFESPLGIRTITWDSDYPYFNGKKYELYGFGIRYDYPALGTAVPAEQHWRDIKLVSECGGNLIRPGHVPNSPSSVDACDAYGVAIAQPSGDNEFSLLGRPVVPLLAGAASTPQDQAKAAPSESKLPDHVKKYKMELHRDIIVRDRNHPSIAFWEASNGGCAPGLVAELKQLTDTWDNLAPRELSPRGSRDYDGRDLDAQPDRDKIKPIGACGDGIPTKREFPNHPIWTAESWLKPALRYDMEGSITKAETYLKKAQDSKAAKLFGFAHWYISDTCGEDFHKDNFRSLACSALDGNRIPQLIYKIYQNAAWIPYAIKPGVTLGTHWNRSGTVSVKVWSNCPRVALYLNKVSLGTQAPEAPFGEHPFRCEWQVPWSEGTLKAVGMDRQDHPVCVDQVVTAGAPDHIELSVEQPLIRPDGKAFKVESNGSDAAFILAKIVDRKGNVCPNSSPTIKFAVFGPGVYCGSWNQEVTPGQSFSYHAPGDYELNAEAGLMKIAVRSTFVPGTVTVTAESPNLKSAKTAFQTFKTQERDSGNVEESFEGKN